MVGRSKNNVPKNNVPGELSKRLNGIYLSKVQLVSGIHWK